MPVQATLLQNEKFLVDYWYRYHNFPQEKQNSFLSIFRLYSLLSYSVPVLLTFNGLILHTGIAYMPMPVQSM